MKSNKTSWKQLREQLLNEFDKLGYQTTQNGIMVEVGEKTGGGYKVNIAKKESANKYKNKRIVVDGINFQSVKESRRYGVLKIMKLAGEIVDFECQYPFKVYEDGKWMFTYKADFRVEVTPGVFEIEDVKPLDKKTGKFLTTSTFNLKKKMVESYFGITIKLI